MTCFLTFPVQNCCGIVFIFELLTGSQVSTFLPSRYKNTSGLQIEIAHSGKTVKSLKMHAHGRKNPCVQLASQRASSVGTGSCEEGIFINLLMLLTLCPSNDSSPETLRLEDLIGQGGIYRQSSTVFQINTAFRDGAAALRGDGRNGLSISAFPSPRRSRLCCKAVSVASCEFIGYPLILKFPF